LQRWAASADGGWVRHAPAAGGAPRFFTVAEDGRLLDPPPSAPPPAGAAAGWVDACIIDSPPAKGRAPGAAAPLPPLRAAAAPAAPGPPPPARRRPPRDLFLVGPWATAPCDLLLWGCGCTPLPHLSVKHLTLRLVRLQALDRSPTTYSPGQAVLPALRGHTASGTADPNAVQALAQRQSAVFLAKLAASQAAAGAAAAAAAAAGPSRDPRRRPPVMTNDDFAAIYRQPWMQPSRPRAPPAQRAAQRQGLAAGQTQNAACRDDALDPLATRAVSPGGPVWRSAWARAHAQDRRRHHRAFAWALLHAALPCGAGRAPYLPRDADGLAAAACCGNAACRPGHPANAAAPQAGVPETLLHALIECPAVGPALHWAADVWARIEGGAGLLSYGTDHQKRPAWLPHYSVVVLSRI
jgi:hypothetical protein